MQSRDRIGLSISAVWPVQKRNGLLHRPEAPRGRHSGSQTHAHMIRHWQHTKACASAATLTIVPEVRTWGGNRGDATATGMARQGYGPARICRHSEGLSSRTAERLADESPDRAVTAVLLVGAFDGIRGVV